MFRRRGQQAATSPAPTSTGPARADAAAVVVYPMPQADQVDAVHGPATDADSDEE